MPPIIKDATTSKDTQQLERIPPWESFPKDYQNAGELWGYKQALVKVAG